MCPSSPGLGAELSLATPCDVWTVRDLLDHMNDEHEAIVAALLDTVELDRNPASPADSIALGLGFVTFIARLTATVTWSVSADHVSIASGVDNAIARTESLAAG